MVLLPARCGPLHHLRDWARRRADLAGDDTRVDRPAENRAERRRSEVDPDPCPGVADKVWTESPRRVDRRAAEWNCRQVDGDERERDRDQGARTEAAADARLKDH